MSPTVAIFRREVMARRELFLMAAVVAIMISLLPILPNIEAVEATDVRTAGSSVSAMALGWVLALVLGTTIFGSELSEGRSGFFLARPVSGSAVWWGRVMAAMTLVWVVEVIVLVPAFFSEGIDIFTPIDRLDWLTILGFVAAPLLLFLGANAASIMLRARSAWLFLDLVGVVAVPVVLWWTLGRILFTGAVDAFAALLGAFVLILMVGLAAGGLAGVSFGRSDLRSAHQWLSIVLWLIVALGLAGAWTGARWMRDFGPTEFSRVEIDSVAANGEWIEISAWGQRRLDVVRRFLVSTTDNQFVALPHNWQYFLGEAQFSRDGSMALWRWVGADGDLSEFQWVDLDNPRPEARRSTLIVSSGADTALSADGSRCAVLEDGVLSVYETSDDRLLTATHLPDPLRRATAIFESNQILRIYGRQEGRLDSPLSIAAMDIGTGKIVLTGEIGGLGEHLVLALDGGLKHAFIWSRSEAGTRNVKRFVDAVDGSVIREAGHSGWPRFLADGRLLSLAVDGDRPPKLIVDSVEGGDQIAHEIDGGEALKMIGEVLPGVVAVSRLVDPTDRTFGIHVDAVDLATGEVRTIGKNLRGALSWGPWQPGRAGAVFWYSAEPEASRFFVDQAGAVVRWDPESGQLVHVIGGGR